MLTIYRLNTDGHFRSGSVRLLNLPGFVEKRRLDQVLLADCLLVHVPSLLASHGRAELARLRSIVPKSQVWIADTLESSVNYPDLNDPEFMSMFDIEVSYRKSADIWRSYVGHDFDVRIKGAAPGRKRRRFCCAFVSSGFHESGRRDLMKNLMERLPVHSYGKLFRNRRLWFDKGIPSKLKALEKYTYTLALENSIDQDYVTEKFFEPLMTGTIPIYLGAPNIDDFAPGENCFINVNDFASVDALADFLKTADPAQFHAWRDKPLSPQFLAIVEEMRRPFESRLANLIRQKRAEKSPSSS